MTNRLKYFIGGGALLVALFVWIFSSSTHTSKNVILKDTTQAKAVPMPGNNVQSQLNAAPKLALNSNSTDTYNSASNLQTLINEMTLKSSNSAELDLIKAKAWDECGSMIHNPQAIDAEIASLTTNGGKYANYRISALRRIKSRCKDFAFGAGDMTRATASELYAKAEKGGNPEANAMELAKSISSLSPAQAKGDVLKTIESGDPAAIFAISSAFGVDGPFQTTPGGEAGTNLSQFAWQLVACDAGMDCSASSAMVVQSCLYLGICGPGDYRDNLQYSAVSPLDYQTITQVEAGINAAIANGSLQTLLISK